MQFFLNLSNNQNKVSIFVITIFKNFSNQMVGWILMFIIYIIKKINYCMNLKIGIAIAYSN